MERLLQKLYLDHPLTTAELFTLHQEIAGQDARRRGGGQERLLAAGCTWVLVKTRTEILRWPEPGEELTLGTWPLKGRLGLHPRAFELCDANGERLVQTDSLWAIMDVEDRTMISGESRGIELRDVEDERLSLMRRLVVPEGGESFSLTPTPEQIDENGHMNNAAYLDAAAALLPEELRGWKLRGISVDYEHEILPGRRAQVRVVRAGDCCFFEGSMENKVCFRLSERFAVEHSLDERVALITEFE